MNRTQFIESVANRAGSSIDDANKVLTAVTDEIALRVSKGEAIKITGFGIFERRRRSGRMGRNPATGQSVRVKAINYPHFRPGTELREVVAGSKKAVKAAPVREHATAKHAAVVKTRPSTNGVSAGAAKTTAKKPTKTTARAATKTPAKKMAPTKAATKAPAKALVKSSAKSSVKGTKAAPAKTATAKSATKAASGHSGRAKAGSRS